MHKKIVLYIEVVLKKECSEPHITGQRIVPLFDICMVTNEKLQTKNFKIGDIRVMRFYQFYEVFHSYTFVSKLTDS